MRARFSDRSSELGLTGCAGNGYTRDSVSMKISSPCKSNKERLSLG